MLSQRNDALLRQDKMRLSSGKRAQRIDSHSVLYNTYVKGHIRMFSFRNFYNLCLSLCYTSNRETEVSPLKLEHIFSWLDYHIFKTVSIYYASLCTVRLGGMSYVDAGSKLSSREKLLPRMARPALQE